MSKARPSTHPWLRPRVANVFKLHGFRLRPDALSHLEKVLSPLADDQAELDAWTQRLVDALQHIATDAAAISKEMIERVVQECSNDEVGDEAGRVLNVIDAFRVPSFVYSEERRRFNRAEADKSKLYADAESKAEVFRSRYTLLHQRTLRHELFSQTSLSVAGSTDPSKRKFRLRSVDSLLGTTTRTSDVVVLGMLTQVKVGTFSLEDPTGVLTLDMTETKFHTGIYTESSFVLVEGWYDDRVLHATAIGFPPAEPAAASIVHFGHANVFGGPLEESAKKCAKLKQIEDDAAGAMFVFVSDLWLDRVNVFDRLIRLLAGYAAMPPTCFVLMGNFLAAPYGSQQAKVLREHFKTLGERIAEFPQLVEKSKFVFVAGPNDPGFANIYPRPGLPKYVTEELLKKVPTAEFATNPCRIQYCTQELVVLRDDIVTKMCRNCIYFPETGDIPTHFAKTLVSQGHLAPMPMHISPVHWDFDRAMYLYPLPDLVVIGDKFDTFTVTNTGCTIVNTGSFGKNDFTFKTYVPATREVEDCQVPDDE